MKIYGLKRSGHTCFIYFKTMDLAKKYLLKVEPTAKRQARRSANSGCEVYDNWEQETYCIKTLNLITK